MLNFYSNPMSPFASKVHYFLEEAGLAYKYHNVQLMKGEQHGEAYRQINPLGQVPAIELDGVCLAESNAVMRYLAQKKERYDLYPVNLEDRARVDMMTEFCTLHVNRFLVTMAWNLYFGPKFVGSPTDHRAVDEARAALLKGMAKLEVQLAGRSFLAGAAPTIADCCLAPFLALHSLAQVSLADYPNAQAWLARMTARPAWQRFQAELQKALG